MVFLQEGELLSVQSRAEEQERIWTHRLALADQQRQEVGWLLRVSMVTYWLLWSPTGHYADIQFTMATTWWYLW